MKQNDKGRSTSSLDSFRFKIVEFANCRIRLIEMAPASFSASQQLSSLHPLSDQIQVLPWLYRQSSLLFSGYSIQVTDTILVFDNGKPHVIAVSYTHLTLPTKRI